MRTMRFILLSWLLLPSLFTGVCTAADRPRTHGEIIWDSYGVPHIFAKNAAATFYGFGYAQARAHGNLLLHLYGESRGRAAEYWGPQFLAADRYLLANDAWPRAQLWYSQQSTAMRDDLDAFAAGINAYAAEHREDIAETVRAVLPVSGVDDMAHWEHVMQFLYVAPATKIGIAGASIARLEPTGPAESIAEEPGSNAWALGTAKISRWARAVAVEPASLLGTVVHDLFRGTAVGTRSRYVRSDAGWFSRAALLFQRRPWAHQHGQPNLGCHALTV